MRDAKESVSTAKLAHSAFRIPHSVCCIMIFDYDLPPELIAQEAVEPRDAARLMVLDRRAGSTAHRSARDLPDLLDPGDLLVANDTKVLPARLAARRATGGRVEVLLIRPRPGGTWQAMIRSGGRVRPGDVLRVGEGSVVVSGHDGDDWTVRIEGMEPAEMMALHGKAPLPPYIKRPLTGDARAARDAERYQTVFSRASGAVAAPTAGLHFTPDLIARLQGAGVRWTTLTLHVGPGTFRTADGAAPEPERYEIPETTIREARRAKSEAKRIVAVGTTSCRALETWAASGRASGETELVVLPGHVFRAVDALLTNFHLPRTSLLALVCAFAGSGLARDAYEEAVKERYRFYSYGDAMLIL